MVAWGVEHAFYFCTGWIPNCLKALYRPGGYVFYGASIVSTLALVIWLAVSRLSIARLQFSRLRAFFAAIFSLMLLWMYTDIFWADTFWAQRHRIGIEPCT
jgi:hypothetical protein